MKCSNDAILQAAATIAASKLESQATLKAVGKASGVAGSEMNGTTALVSSVQEILVALQLVARHEADGTMSGLKTFGGA